VTAVGNQSVVNANKTGTKCAAVHCFTLQPQSCAVVRCRLCHVSAVLDDAFGEQFDSVFMSRQHECDEFYSHVSHSLLDLLTYLLVNRCDCFVSLSFVYLQSLSCWLYMDLVGCMARAVVQMLSQQSILV